MNRLKLLWLRAAFKLAGENYSGGGSGLSPGRADRSAALSLFRGDYSELVRMGFKLNPALYAGVMYKVRAITQAPLFAHEDDDSNPRKLDLDHPLQKLMRRPNRNLTGEQWMAYRILTYNIAGNAYTWIERDGTGNPVALWPLRPDRVSRIDRGYDEAIRARRVDYVYDPIGRRPGVRKSPIPEEDMIHDKFIDPTDQYTTQGEGFSPLNVAANAYQNDNAFSGLLSTLVKTGLMPSGVVWGENAFLSDKEAKDIGDKIERKYSGSANWWRPIVLSDGLRYDPLPMVLEEELFRAVDARNETRILMILGVDPILLRTVEGMSGTTYTNMIQAEKSFWNHAYAYDLKMMASTVDLRLGDGVRFLFDISRVPALTGDLAQQVETYLKMIRGLIPPDIAAAKVGLDLDELPDGVGQKSYISADLMPIDMALAGGDNEGMMRRAAAQRYEDHSEVIRQAEELVKAGQNGR